MEKIPLWFKPLLSVNTETVPGCFGDYGNPIFEWLFEHPNGCLDCAWQEECKRFKKNASRLLETLKKERKEAFLQKVFFKVREEVLNRK